MVRRLGDTSVGECEDLFREKLVWTSAAELRNKTLVPQNLNQYGARSPSTMKNFGRQLTNASEAQNCIDVAGRRNIYSNAVLREPVFIGSLELSHHTCVFFIKPAHATILANNFSSLEVSKS